MSTSVFGFSTVIREQVERIVATPDFAGFPRSVAFLRYVVEQTLAGRGDELKESVIGVEVYGRDPGYNPKVDSVVRTQARRVREKLNEYYNVVGKDDPVRIEIPKGAYVPEFKVGAEAAAAKPARKWGAVAAGLAILAAGGAAAALATRHTPPGEQVRTIAILPFSDADPSKRFDTLAAGLTEDLERDLSRVRALRLHAHPSGAPDVAGRSSYATLGKELDVDALIDGRISSEAGRSELHVSLVRAADGTELWADHFPADEPSTALERSVEAGVAGALGVALPPGQAHPENPQAHDLFIEGRALWATRIPEKGRQAIRLFEQAARIDPDYALAYMGIADTYGIMGANEQIDTATALAEGMPAARKALELDPDLAEAHAAFGMLEALAGHLKVADAEYQRAIELNPSYDRAYAREGTLRFTMGDFPGAERFIRESERLNPYSTALPLIRAELYYYWRRYGDSENLIQTVLHMDPKNPLAFQLLARDYLEQNQPERALAASRRALALAPDSWLCQSELVSYLSRAGKKDEAERLLARVLHPKAPDRPEPLTLAGMYARMRQQPKTIGYLESALRARDADMASLRFDPVYDFVRADPQFQAVMSKVAANR